MANRIMSTALAAAMALSFGMTTDALAQSKPKKEPTAGQMAARERMSKCSAEWKEAKAGGKVEPRDKVAEVLERLQRPHEGQERLAPNAEALRQHAIGGIPIRFATEALMRIERCTGSTLDDWVALRLSLWPDSSEADQRAEAEAMLEHPGQAAAFLARSPEGDAAGFAEATLRQDHVNGCATSPVAFLEGIFVRPQYRRRGIARLLIRAVEDWGAILGCTEFASDADLHNTVSHRMHAALGFEETERVVYFRKPLRR